MAATKTDLERVNVNLAPRARDALDEMMKRTADTKTDIINRALQICAFLGEIEAKGGAIYIRDGADAELERLRFF